MGPLVPLFWTYSDISGFQSHSGQLYLHLVEVYMMYVPRDSPLVQQLPSSSWPAWWQVTVPHMFV